MRSGRQARVPGKADRARAVRGRRADRARRKQGLKFTIGYSQRFNPKFAYVKKKIADGTLGEPVSALRQPAYHARPRQEDHRPRQALARRDGVDPRPRFPALVLEPAKPVRVYSQGVTPGDVPEDRRLRSAVDHGHAGQRLAFVVGGGWSLPPGYPNFSTTWIEMIGTEGALIVDDSHRDVVLSTPWRTARCSRCRPCRASRWITSMPARWGRRRCISSKRWRATGRCW